MCAGLDGAGGQLGEKLVVHGDDGVGLEPDGLVGVDAAGRARPLAGQAPGREAVGLADRVQDVRERLRPTGVSGGAHGSETGVSSAVVEPIPTDLLPPCLRPAVLTSAPKKSESGCSDPPRHQERPRGKERATWINHKPGRTELLCGAGRSRCGAPEARWDVLPGLETSLV